MTTTNGGGPEGSAPANQAAPQLNVLAQYVKDLSFENPNAPRSLQQQQAQPQINIQINVNAKPLADSDYEVELKIEGRAAAQRARAIREGPLVREPERAAFAAAATGAAADQHPDQRQRQAAGR
jgi:hypothetical protein